MNTTQEMPKYRSHKEIWALKIKSIVKDGEGENRESDGSAIITPEEEGYAPFEVDLEYMLKHNPKVGGYYVVYEDGYKSFSPANAFEKGNTLIKERTFLESLQIEEKELGEKIVALNNFMNTNGISYTLGMLQFELLGIQHSAMLAYRRVLRLRISNLQSTPML